MRPPMERPVTATGERLSWSVGELAEAAHVTVRALHHYDRIGLLVPSGRTASGHRRYAASDLQRLQRLLFYRELGFPLGEVADLLNESRTDPVEQLDRQHTLLRERAAKLQAMAEALSRTIAANKIGITLTPKEMFDVFAEFDPTQYADEVQQRWGNTTAYRQSTARTARYTATDWERVQAEGAAVQARLAAAMNAGLTPDSQEAMDAAEWHRQQISRNFYDCPPQMHRALAQMYVTDERFTATYEQVAPGLAQYVHDAVMANADRSESAQD